MLTTILIIAGILFAAFVIFGIVSDIKEKKEKEEYQRKLNEAHLKLCRDGNCSACGKKLINTNAYYIYARAFYKSQVYRNLCLRAYYRLPVSNPDNEFHMSFNGWKDTAAMVDDMSDNSTVTICQNCFKTVN